MNDSVWNLMKITRDEYLDWCKKNKLAYYKKDVRNCFFKKLYEGEIVRDNATKKLVDIKGVGNED